VISNTLPIHYLPEQSKRQLTGSCVALLVPHTLQSKLLHDEAAADEPAGRHSKHQTDPEVLDGWRRRCCCCDVASHRCCNVVGHSCCDVVGHRRVQGVTYPQRV